MSFLALQGNPLYAAWYTLTGGQDPNDWYGPVLKVDKEQILAAADILGIEESSEEFQQIIRLIGLVEDSFVPLHALRQIACRKFSFAVPPPGIIGYLATCSPLIEMGAGKGYWSALLAGEGADIIAFDDDPPSDQETHYCTPGLFYDVRRGDSAVVRDYPDRTLLLVWPPYHPDVVVRWQQPEDENGWERRSYMLGATQEHTWRRPNLEPDMSTEVLQAYEAAGGQRVVYVGEGPGGCTGSDAFHARLGLRCAHYDDESCHCPAPRWELSEEYPIAQWSGIHDTMCIFHRRLTIAEDE